MKLIEKIIELFLGAFLYKKGKDTEKLKTAQEEFEAINEKANIKNRLNTDDAYRDRLRDHFKR